MKLPLLFVLFGLTFTRGLATSITLDPSSGGSSFHGTIDLSGSGSELINLAISNSVFPYNGTLHLGGFSVLHETPSERYFLFTMGWSQSLLGLFGTGAFNNFAVDVPQSVNSHGGGTGQTPIEGHPNEFINLTAYWEVPVTWTGSEYTGVGTWSIELARVGPSVRVPDSGSSLILLSLAIAGLAATQSSFRRRLRNAVEV